MNIQTILSVSLTTALFAFANVAFSLDETNSANSSESTHFLQLARAEAPIPTPDEDVIITDSIKKHIQDSTVLSRFDIGVSTQKGIVTLSGNVNSNSQASSLIELAQSIIGVRDVTSRLTVDRSQQVLRDTVITAKVRGLFLREALFGTKQGVDMMNVETKNGIVHLTGSINNRAEVDRAIELIKGLSGVRGVEYRFSKIVPFNSR